MINTLKKLYRSIFYRYQKIPVWTSCCLYSIKHDDWVEKVGSFNYVIYFYPNKLYDKFKLDMHPKVLKSWPNKQYSTNMPNYIQALDKLKEYQIKELGEIIKDENIH